MKEQIKGKKNAEELNSKHGPDDETIKYESKDEAAKHGPNGETAKCEPKDEAAKHESKGEKVKPSKQGAHSKVHSESGVQTDNDSPIAARAGGGKASWTWPRPGVLTA